MKLTTSPQKIMKVISIFILGFFFARTLSPVGRSTPSGQGGKPLERPTGDSREYHIFA